MGFKIENNYLKYYFVTVPYNIYHFPTKVVQKMEAQMTILLTPRQKQLLLAVL